MRALAVVFVLGLVGLAVAWTLREAYGLGATWAAPARKRSIALLGALAAALGASFAVRGELVASATSSSIAAGAWAAGSVLLGGLCALASRRLMLEPDDAQGAADVVRAVRVRGLGVLFSSSVSSIALAYLVGLALLAHPPAHEDAFVPTCQLALGFCAGQALVYALEGGALLDALVVDSGAGLVLAAAFFERNVERVPSSSPIPALVLFSLVARAFGVVASSAGLAALRTGEGEASSAVTLRAVLVAAFVSVVGVGGSVRWILGESHALSLYYCALLGVAAAISLLFVPPRWSVAPIGVALVTALGAYALASQADLAGAGPFGVVVALAGMAGPSGVMLALDRTDRETQARAYASASSALSAFVVLGACLVIMDEQACSTWLRTMDLPDAGWVSAIEHCHVAGPVFSRAELGPSVWVSAAVGAALGIRVSRACARDGEARPATTMLVVAVPLGVAAVFAATRATGAVSLAAVVATGGAAVMASLVGYARVADGSVAALRGVLALLGAIALAVAPIV